MTDALTQTRTSNMDNEITGISGGSWTTPVYNSAGAMMGMPNAGSSHTPARVAQYDAWGRLVRITAGFNTAGTYVYDGLNRRIIKNTYTSGSISETRHYYYSDQWQVLEERVGTATTADRQYVWGMRYVDELILRDRDTGSGNERLYCMQDDNWNLVAICSGSAAVQERYAYTPYGMVTFLNSSFGSIGSSAFSWNYLFTGRERDTESALQLNRNRYYHARLGCWISRDPLGYKARDVNLYRYVLNNPTLAPDPEGLFPSSCYKPCMKCGPEIGPALELTLANVRRHLQNVPWLTKFFVKQRLALGIGWQGWDITGLTALDHQGACFSERVGTVCETCVQVYGVKQDLWEVNYALWGMMMSAIDVELNGAYFFAAAWKTLKAVAFGEPNPCRPTFQFNATVMSWIKTGYKMYDPWFWQTQEQVFNAYRPSSDNPRFAKCSSCGDSYSRTFKYQLIDKLQ